MSLTRKRILVTGGSGFLGSHQGFLRLMNTPDDVTGPVNIGNPHEIPVAELARRVVRVTYSPSEIIYRPLSQDDLTQRCPDITLARTLLQWESAVALDDGLTSTIDYFRDLLAAQATMPTLSEVTNFWGDREFRPELPGCETVTDALYAPMRSSPGFGQDPEWGLYDRHGLLVPGAAYAHGPGPQLVGQSPHRDVDRSALPVLDDEFVYGGPILLHYGHFVVSTLARMWAMAQVRGTRRILWHADMPPETWFQFEHVRTVFGALNLTPEDFVRPEHPCVLRSVIVPSPSFQEQSFVHAAFAEVGRSIGRIWGIPDKPPEGRPVYVSKTHLSLGINRLSGEVVLDEELERLGFDILHPTDLPLVEQVRVMARARTISGSVGSAFHTTMFLGRPVSVVGLCPINSLITNLPLVDMAVQNQATYLFPVAEATRRTDEDPNFHVTWTLPDPVAAAREIAERA